MLIFSWGGVQAAIYLVKCILAKSEFDLIKTILLIVKGPTVFWFLYMLIPLYFISPVLCEILRKQSACIYFFVAWFIGTIVVNSILSIWPSLNDVVQLNNIGLFSSYMGYYLFGAYYGKYGMNSRTKYIIYCLGILSILMMLFCEPVGFFHNFVTPFNMFWSISVFLFFDGIKLSSHRINKLLQSFSKKTLGIYAIHVYCIRLITKIWAPSVSYCILQVFFYFVFAVVASYVATMILKKIKFLKRIV